MVTIAEAIKRLEEFEKNQKLAASELLDELNRISSKAAKKVQSDFGEYQRQTMTNMFNMAVSEFYDAYDPKKYVRKGDVGGKRGGIYDILSIQLEPDGTVLYEDDYAEVFDYSKLVGRDGEDVGLGETVFEEGWHGGAKSINESKAKKWHEHPEPGVPYYRAGGYVVDEDTGTRYWHRYGQWGKRATPSESPYNAFIRYMKPYDTGGFKRKHKEIWDKHFQPDFSKFVKEFVPQVEKKYGL